jgi:hypothetical protein
MPDTLSDLRQHLNRAFDDAELDAFCLDYVPEVFDKFGRGLRRSGRPKIGHGRTRKDTAKTETAAKPYAQPVFVRVLA